MPPSPVPLAPPAFEPRDAAFERRVRESFARQGLMGVLGAELVVVRPGEVAIAAPYRGDLTQQHGYLHAAVVTALADSACGYAALSLMPAGRDVLSVEFKVNLLAPAAGERFTARGVVVRPGRTLTVCTAQVVAEGRNGRTTIAVMQATMIALDPPEPSAA
jgi:uncharacterized protein (TIGR00369 family)